MLRGARRHRLDASANCSPRGICYVPQGRNIFPELSVRHNIELGARRRWARDQRSAGADRSGAGPVSRRCAARRRRQASTLSGGEQKQLEIARGLLLDPQLMLIDEPSIGLSPLMVQETFDILKELRDRGVIDPDDRAERALRA